MVNFKPLFFSLLLVVITAVVVKVLIHLGYGITYVASKSMPSGFYLIVPPQQIKRYDIIQFYPPLSTVQFLHKHHWGSPNNLMLKYVYGMPQDFVCNKDRAVWINGKKVAPIFIYCAPGQRLPQNNFCAKLNNDEYLLLSNKIARSFDGRYFGSVKRSAIRGKALHFRLFLRKPSDRN